MKTSCHCILLRQVSRKMTALYDAAMAPFGITIAQYSLISRLNRLGQASLTELGEDTDLDRSTIGRNIRLLERMELVATSRSPQDQREMLAVLTAVGEARLAAARPVWAQVQQDIEARIGTDRLAVLKEIAETF
jgi:DNA-binding MarR family transcriptional regulator